MKSNHINFVLGVVLVSSFYFMNVQADDRPNFIHIFVDDLGYGDIGCFGATDIQTPNIDLMADQGIKFTEFYSAASLCSPSRAALLTGRYPQRSGCNRVFYPDSYTGLPSSEITLAEILKGAGYSTGIVGKWHLGHREKFLPLQNGFDEYFGIPFSNDMNGVVYMRGNEVVDFHVDQSQITQTYTKEALQFIENHNPRKPGKPFFLYLAHAMPHVPIYASKSFIGTSDRGLYGDVVQEIDWSVGQILTKLEELGLLENTLIIFSSDNGPSLKCKELGGSAWILREGKGTTFEGGMRVPTVALWKAQCPGDLVYDDLVTQMDWFPTFARLAGASIPENLIIDGEDLTEVLRGTGKRSGDWFLYFKTATLQCFRKGDWKVKVPFQGQNLRYKQWKICIKPHGKLLFNLKDDPGESNNLYDSIPEIAKFLFESMTKEFKNMGDLPTTMVTTIRADKSHELFLKQKYDTPEKAFK